MATAMSETAASVDRLHEHPLGWIITGSVDPSAGAGVAAPIGTIYSRNTGSAGTLFVKAGAADTSWKLITQAA
jgi:hypothetical protein